MTGSAPRSVDSSDSSDPSDPSAGEGRIPARGRADEEPEPGTRQDERPEPGTRDGASEEPLGLPAGRLPAVVDVVVIGGGVAGLVAARDVARAGRTVVVLEARGRTGGMLASAAPARPNRENTATDPACVDLPAHSPDSCTRGPFAGIPIDVGAEAFAVRGGVVEAFARELGFGDADIVEPRPLGSWTVSAGEAHRLPAHGLLGIPGDLDDPAVIEAIGAEGLARARRDLELDAEVGADARSLADLVRARMGDAVLERLVTPVCRGVYSIDPAELDHARIAPGLVDRIREHGSLSAAVAAGRRAVPPGAAVRGIRGGMHAFAAALAADAERAGARIVTDARVAAVEPGAAEETDGRAGARVVAAVPPTWCVRLADGAVVRARAVLRTVPEASLAPARGAPESDGSGSSGRSGGAGTARSAGDAGGDGEVPVEVVALLVESDALDAHPRGTGVLVGEPANGIRAKALTHVTAKWPWVEELARAAGDAAGAREHRHVLRLSYPPARPGDDRALTEGLADDAVRALAAADASAILGVRIEPDAVVGLARAVWRMPAPAARLRPATAERSEADGPAEAEESGATEPAASRSAAPGFAEPPARAEAAPGILVLAGTWHDGTGLASVIPGARRAAREALAALEGALDGPA